MKFGFRKPSLKRSLKARTTGKLKRKIKKITHPFYGKKGSGWFKKPKKAAYNKIYKKTSFGLRDLFKCLREAKDRPLWTVFLNKWLFKEQSSSEKESYVFLTIFTT